MNYEIISVTHYSENIQTDPLSNYTWQYREWANVKFGLLIREVRNPYYPDSSHVIAFKKVDGFYKEISQVDWNLEAGKTKTLIARLL